MEFPDPLTPADCELQDFAFMPLDVGRLRDSDLGSNVPHAQCWYAVLLWCASWHQVPAASLPDNDQTLAKLAGFGHFVKEWKKVRAGALYGWVKCSDGRLYHPVVAEKAIDAWKAKLEQRWKTECARIKKHNQRHDPGLPYPTLEEFLAQRNVPVVPRDIPTAPTVSPEGRPQFVPEESGSKGQGQGQGQGQGYIKPSGEVIVSGKPPREPFDDFTPKDAAEWLRHFRTKHGFEADPTNVNDRKKLWPVFAGWVNAGLTASFVDAAVASASALSRDPIVCLPLYVDRFMANQQAARASPQVNARDESRRRAAEVLTSVTMSENHEPPNGNVIDVNAKLLG